MLEIQKFLRSHYNDWEEVLTAPPYSLSIKKKNGLVLFNYNNYSSERSNKIVQEARGLILEEKSWEVVRIGFTRFFNIGEEDVDDIDWSDSIGTEKLDGTLIFIYYYKGWHVGTRSTFDAEDALLNSSSFKSYKELFDFVAATRYPDFCIDNLDKQFTYCLELCSIYNQCVVIYNEPQLWHILTRSNNNTCREVDMEIGIPKPIKYICNSKEEYEKIVKNFDKTHEGIVVKDYNGRRVKIKTESYFELHKKACNGHINKAKAIELIITGESSEFLSYFSQYRDYFKNVSKELKRQLIVIYHIQRRINWWKYFNPNCGRKEFAEWVNRYLQEWSNIAFLAYEERIFDMLATKDAKKLMKLLHIKED